MMYFILSGPVEGETIKIRHLNLHSMRFGIGDYKAFTSVGKMYALANVWTESDLGWGDSMKNILSTCR
jgi:hypothetical protein